MKTIKLMITGMFSLGLALAVSAQDQPSSGQNQQMPQDQSTTDETQQTPGLNEPGTQGQALGQNQQGDFTTWDEDSDGIVNNDEFQSGLENEGWFGNYDTNSDNMIDDKEWQAAREQNDYLEEDYYSTWDSNQDGMLGADEFNEGAYGTWDADGDNQITQSEYDENYSNWSRR